MIILIIFLILGGPISFILHEWDLRYFVKKYNLSGTSAAWKGFATGHLKPNGIKERFIYSLTFPFYLFLVVFCIIAFPIGWIIDTFESLW